MLTVPFEHDDDQIIEFIPCLGDDDRHYVYVYSLPSKDQSSQQM